MDFKEWPYCAKVTKSGLDLPTKGSSDYDRSLLSTRQFLEERSLPVRYTTYHRFMKMNKHTVESCGELFDEVLSEKIDVEPFCLVGNKMLHDVEVPLTPIVDYKIWKGDEWWKSSPEVTDCFSIRTFGYGPLQILLESKYPRRCKYEGK